jgi:hypothetical protein
MLEVTDFSQIKLDDEKILDANKVIPSEARLIASGIAC